MSASRLTNESTISACVLHPIPESASLSVLPGCGGAATIKPYEAIRGVKNNDCSGKPHDPCEKRSRGKCAAPSANGAFTTASNLGLIGCASAAVGYHTSVSS